MLTLIIRQMKEEDIPFVQEIAKTSWYATYEGIIPMHIQNRFLEAAYSEERLLTRLQTSPFLVAKLGESLVGFANFSNVNDNGQAELFAIYLLPGAQNKGIGTALLESGIQKLQGITSLTVCVEKDNIIGSQFYKAKDFQPVEEFDDLFDGHILQTIRLELALTKK
ncbi:GNAT family N-acetyltransferase [Lysinibacillus sp. NPDC093210]|uniref:GNAT family N-acetyltransferase n=1 Tax=Lysinibacillus sp. NPDC093210 TaxID=3364133 RepID=UPI00381591A7